jgi:hypothetical protein
MRTTCEVPPRDPESAIPRWPAHGSASATLSGRSAIRPPSGIST